MRLPLAHVSEFLTPGSPSTWSLWLLVAFAIVAVLTVEHHVVKHGHRSLRRMGRTGIGIALVMSLSGVTAAPAGAQEWPEPLAGLPDLISDEPFLWFTRNVPYPDGSIHRVLTFAGFLHNIGEGSLDLFGNPQIPGGVKQRVFDGENWEEVGTPTVRYETDDGHNHFHLISAVTYALWNDARTEEVDPASKVGFCLIDTEQVEQRSEAFYDIGRFNYCSAEDPGATELRMGITPGWRDLYDANTTLQWVDISEVRPGRYWVSAITDPNNEIVESNEDNNGLVFSRNKFEVPGYVARELPTQSPDEAIRLKSDVYGIVGDRAFVIVDPPANGSLDVPTGVSLLGDEVTYRPDAGFTGTDSFTYYARDTEAMFPLTPEPVTVHIDVTDASDAAGVAPADVPSLVLPDEPVVSDIWDPVEWTAELSGPGSGAIVWYSGGLPPGLHMDPSTGVVSGTANTGGAFDVTVVAVIDGREVRGSFEWIINSFDIPLPSLLRINDLNTPVDLLGGVFLGTGQDGDRYEASGLPEGTNVVPNLPLLAGTAEEFGVFDVEVRELLDGEVVDTINFTWTVRPQATPAFVV